VADPPRFASEARPPSPLSFLSLFPFLFSVPVFAQTHQIHPQQTWYGIAREYNLSVEALQEANPNVSALQPGDVLRLPQAVTLPEMVLNIPFDSVPEDFEPATKPELTCADTLKILAILPFQFDADTLPTGGDDPRVIRLREIAMEIYYGARWGAEELRAAGLDVSLRVVDAEPDSLGGIWTLEDIFWADVVMGPLRRQALDSAMGVTRLLAKPHWSLTRNVASQNAGSHVFIAEPDETAAARALGAAAARLHSGEEVTMLYTGLHDADLEAAFAQGFEAARDSADLPLQRVLVNPKFAEGVASRLDTGRTHVFAVPAGKASRAMIADLQYELLKADTVSARLFMNPEVRDFDFIDRRLMDSTKMVTPAADWLNWGDTLVWERVALYRDITGTDPSDYALLAHDVVVESANWCEKRVAVPGPLARRFEWESGGVDRPWRNTAWKVERYENGWWIDVNSSDVDSTDVDAAVVQPVDSAGQEVLPLWRPQR
jgi:LysM repeat protein